MTTSLFAQPPDNEVDLRQWRKDIHRAIFGDENSGGSLDGDNVVSASDPGTADGTLASVTTVVNDLVDNLQTTGIVEE